MLPTSNTIFSQGETHSSPTRSYRIIDTLLLPSNTPASWFFSWISQPPKGTKPTSNLQTKPVEEEKQKVHHQVAQNPLLFPTINI